MNSASARARFAGATRSPIQLVAVGAHAASPTPTPSRETISPPKLVTTAASAVSDAPDHHASAEQPFAAPQIGHAAERHADNRIENRERRAQQSHLRIVKVKLLAHRLDQRAGDVAIVEIQDVDKEQNDDGERCAFATGHWQRSLSHAALPHSCRSASVGSMRPRAAPAASTPRPSPRRE